MIKRATNLDRHWRESKQEKERLRGKRETGAPAPKLNIPATAGRVQGQ